MVKALETPQVADDLRGVLPLGAASEDLDRN